MVVKDKEVKVYLIRRRESSLRGLHNPPGAVKTPDGSCHADYLGKEPRLSRWFVQIGTKSPNRERMVKRDYAESRRLAS